MKSHYVIGLDFGTASGRAVLMDTNGALMAATSMEYPHGVMDDCLPDGTPLLKDWALQYPGDYLDALETMVKFLISESGIAANDIIGLSLDFTASTILPVDRDLVPLCMKPEYKSRPHAYVKLWKHHAAQKQADRINEYLEENSLNKLPRFGGKISAEIQLPKIVQILEEDPDIYLHADQILEAMDWLCQLLTGNLCRTGSTAAYKAFWDRESGYPEPGFFKGIHPGLINLTRDKLRGDICPVGEKFGELNAQWAGRLGLKTGTAVGAGIIDAHAGLPGCGITKPGQMLLVLGTSSVQAVLSHNPWAVNGICGAVKGGIMPGYYALESGLAAVGDMFNWFVTQCLPGSYEREAQAAGISPHAYLAEKSRSLEPGCSGLMALDWWNGNKTPYVDAGRCGLLLGCTLSTKPEHIYRALMEATAFGTRMIMDAFEEAGIKTDVIYACGGITHKNPLLMQIYSDVLNREIYVSAWDETPAVGSAMYAAVAAGPDRGGYASIFEAAAKMSRTEKDPYCPDPARAAVYSELYTQYQSLCAMFRPGNDDIMAALKKSGT